MKKNKAPKTFKVICAFCGKDAAINKKESDTNFNVYITNKPCKNCGLQSYAIEEVSE